MSRVTIKKNSSNCRGYSLLEILIAIALGLLLFEVVLQNYLAAKKIYHAETELASLNENIRLADFFLWQNIMQAGYFGCRKISELNLNNQLDDEFQQIHPIKGYAYDRLPYYLFRKVVKDTDVIVITKANTGSVKVVSDVTARAKSITVERNPATKNNKFLLIADCRNADLFVAKNHKGKTIDAKQQLEHSYKSGSSEVGRFEEMAFFISNTGRVDEKNNPLYSLYFSINRSDKHELVLGISGMQIYYGVDTKGSNKIDKYLKAGEIRDDKLWDKVLSVVIELEMQNQSLVHKKKKLYIRLRERS